MVNFASKEVHPRTSFLGSCDRNSTWSDRYCLLPGYNLSTWRNFFVSDDTTELLFLCGLKLIKGRPSLFGKRRLNSTIHQNFFVARVIDWWYRLPKRNDLGLPSKLFQIMDWQPGNNLFPGFLQCPALASPCRLLCFYFKFIFSYTFKDAFLIALLYVVRTL